MRTIAFPSTRTPVLRALPRAFTLGELMIVVLILAILAAIVIPRFSGASELSASSALPQDLRYIRTQIQVYRAQHADTAPGYLNGDTSTDPTADAFVDQMTNPTSIDGQVGSSGSSVYRFGPYLAAMPVNPVNGLRAVWVVADGQTMPGAPAEDLDFGWVYKPATMDFRAYAAGVDEKGVPFYDY